MFDAHLAKVEFEATIPGQPKAWQRARDAGPDGYVNPASYSRWLRQTSQHIRGQWKQAGNTRRLDCPLEVEIAFYLHRPQRRPDGYPRELWDMPPIPAIGRSDVDNYVAAVFDAVTRAGIWIDDTRVAGLRASKIWIPTSQPEGTTIRISSLSTIF